MLKLNVSVSKKAGLPDYGSIGASCSVEVELNSTLLQHDPDAFQQEVRRTYAACTQAVNDELARQQAPQPPVTSSGANGQRPNGTGRHQHGARQATASQVRAIRAIVERQQLELADVLQSRFSTDNPEDLSITEASQLIDELKAQTNGNGTGGRR